MLTCKFLSFTMLVNPLKTKTRKHASTLTHHSTDGDILSRKTKHRCQFVMLWKGKGKRRSYQRLSALAKPLNDNRVLTLIACNGFSNACDKERTSTWFFAHSHAGAHIANSHAGAHIANSRAGTHIANSHAGAHIANSRAGAHIANSQAGALIANSRAGATSFPCMWIALRVICRFWCRCFFNVTINFSAAFQERRAQVKKHLNTC